MVSPTNSFTEHLGGLRDAASAAPFRVFLCGPKLSLRKKNGAADLRYRIRARLIAEGFEVVLGEDEGLLNKDITKLGVNAQDSELLFIKNHCNAVIVVAGSVGSYCELGLFSWHYSHSDGLLNAGKDFILLIDKKYKRHRSYFNLGPAVSINGGRGLIHFADFQNYKIEKILKRLIDQRGITVAVRAGKQKARIP